MQAMLANLESMTNFLVDLTAIDFPASFWFSSFAQSTYILPLTYLPSANSAATRLSKAS